MKMIQSIKKIVQNKKHRNIAVLGILCVAVVGVFMWFYMGNNNPVKDENNPDVLVDMNEPQVPLGNIATTISAGDTVVINVYAAEMDDVYGYQFNINFDRDIIDYKKRFYSDIDEILTIFATDKEWYLLVGATMIGDAKGYSGQEVPVCRVEFIALTDFELNPDFTSDHIALSDVNVVTSDLQYLENVDGWTASMTVY
jgi:hypothetical protein